MHIRLMKTALILSSIAFIGCSQKPQITGVEGMAAQVPASSLFFAGVDAREKMPKDFVSDFDKFKDRPEMAGSMKAWNDQTGLSASLMVKAFDVAGWAVVVDPTGKKNLKELALVAGVWVRDRKQAEACLAEYSKNEVPQKADLQGKSVETYKAGYSVCFSEPFLLLSNRSDGIQAVLQRQGPSLAEDAGFKAAHSQMFQNQSLGFFYSPVTSSLALAAPKQAPTGVRFLAGGVGSQQPYRPLALLSLDPSAASSLIKGLLSAPPSSNSLASSVPANWNFYLMMQMRYPLQAITQISPAALSEAATGLKQAGANPEQVNKAFEGDVALSLDLDQYFAKVPDAPPNGLLLWGLRSGSDFEALWKTFCRSNGLKTKTGKVGTYLVDRFEGLPFLLLARQTKPHSQALLVLGKNPDEVLQKISSLKSGQTMKESQALKAVQPGGGLFALQYDLRNTTQQLKKSGLLGLSPQLAPLQAAVQNWSPEMWQGDMTVQVEKEGVKAEGSPITMAIAGMVKLVILTTFLDS